MSTEHRSSEYQCRQCWRDFDDIESLKRHLAEAALGLISGRPCVTVQLLTLMTGADEATVRRHLRSILAKAEQAGPN